MKKIILTSIILFAVFTVNAQTSQKYNSLYDRTEFFDQYGKMTGYAKINSVYNRVEYYDIYGKLLKYEKQSE